MRSLNRLVPPTLFALATVGVVAVAPAAAAGSARTGPAAVAAATSCAVRWGSLPQQASAAAGTDGLTDVRAGRHACFDRLVLDDASWAWVRYVDQVTEDGSGRPVPLRGGARLEIVTTRSDRVDTGAPTYTPADPGELVDVTGWTTFRQAAFAGSFEGQTTLGLGVRARLPFRVFVLTTGQPSPRVVIDVAHHW